MRIAIMSSAAGIRITLYQEVAEKAPILVRAVARLPVAF